jgi:hypothetical protein
MTHHVQLSATFGSRMQVGFLLSLLHSAQVHDLTIDAEEYNISDAVEMPPATGLDEFSENMHKLANDASTARNGEDLSASAPVVHARVPDEHIRAYADNLDRLGDDDDGFDLDDMIEFLWEIMPETRGKRVQLPDRLHPFKPFILIQAAEDPFGLGEREHVELRHGMAKGVRQRLTEVRKADGFCARRTLQLWEYIAGEYPQVRDGTWKILVQYGKVLVVKISNEVE